MTVKFKWLIEDAEAYKKITVDGVDYHNVVHTVHWRLICADVDSNNEVKTKKIGGVYKELQVEEFGEIYLDTENPAKETFIDVDDLDAETLSHWASVAIDAQGEKTVKAIKTRLRNKLKELKNPESVSLNLVGEVAVASQ